MLKEERLRSFRDIEHKLIKESREFEYIYSYDVTLDMNDSFISAKINCDPFIIRVDEDTEEGLAGLKLMKVEYCGSVISEHPIDSVIDSFRLALADMLDLHLALKEFFDD